MNQLDHQKSLYDVIKLILIVISFVLVLTFTLILFTTENLPEKDATDMKRCIGIFVLLVMLILVDSQEYVIEFKNQIMQIEKIYIKKFIFLICFILFSVILFFYIF